MDYQELIAAILDESLRGDLVSQVPNFVARAEGMIARELRAMEMLEQSELVAADRVEDGRYRLPLDWLEDRQVRVAGITYRKTTLGAVYECLYLNTPASVYAVSGDSVSGGVIEFGRIPSDSDVIVLDYFARPDPLLLPTDTNRLLTAHPTIYQDAALFHLYKYVQDSEQAQNCFQTWAQARDTLNEQAGRFLGGQNSRAFYNMGRFSPGGGY